LSPTDTYTSTPGLLDDEVKRHPKTVKRWTQQPDGLPFAYLGKTPIIHVPTARDWLLGKLRRPNPRRA
jgi:hypothetical protein